MKNAKIFTQEILCYFNFANFNKWLTIKICDNKVNMYTDTPSSTVSIWGSFISILKRITEIQVIINVAAKMYVHTTCNKM